MDKLWTRITYGRIYKDSYYGAIEDNAVFIRLFEGNPKKLGTTMKTFKIDNTTRVWIVVLGIRKTPMGHPYK